MKTVIKRLVFYIQIQLESPLNVASGEDGQMPIYSWISMAIHLCQEAPLPVPCVLISGKRTMNGSCLAFPKTI